MDPEEVTAFFYGLSIDESLLASKGVSASKSTVGYGDGYGLRIGRRATLVPDHANRAYGVLMTLQAADVRALYSDESVADYVSESVSEVPAFLSVKELAPPDDWMQLSGSRSFGSTPHSFPTFHARRHSEALTDELRHFTRGRFELITIAGLTIGRATYEPGWKWSVDVGPLIGAHRCQVEHVGLVLQGRATAAFEDGQVWVLEPGTMFHIPSEPHDSWVVGDEPYVSLHFLGAGHYAK